MITELTKEQEEQIPIVREYWRSIGLSTDPIDKTKAKESIINLYKIAGEDEPMVLFFDSPMACLIARQQVMSIIDILKDNQQIDNKLKYQLRDQLLDQLWDQLRGQLEGQLEGQISGQLRGQIRDQLWGQLWGQISGQLLDQLRDQLGDQLGDQLWGQISGQLRGQIRDQIRGQLWNQLFVDVKNKINNKDVFQSLYFIGGLDSFWIGFYDFARSIGVTYKNSEHLNAYIEYTKNCGIMFAYKGIVFCSDRPSNMHFDDRRLLHNESGYSVKFRDGWGFCSWHGMRIPSEWILDKTLDAKTAIKWDNVEQRRAACEIIGWNNILHELNAKTINKSDNPFVGELLEVEIPDIGKEKFLRVKCGTNREFALPVPPEMERASQAQAWLNFTTEDMYLPQVRT